MAIKMWTISFLLRNIFISRRHDAEATCIGTIAYKTLHTVHALGEDLTQSIHEVLNICSTG